MSFPRASDRINDTTIQTAVGAVHPGYLVSEISTGRLGWGSYMRGSVAACSSTHNSQLALQKVVWTAVKAAAAATTTSQHFNGCQKRKSALQWLSQRPVITWAAVTTNSQHKKQVSIVQDYLRNQGYTASYGRARVFTYLFVPKRPHDSLSLAGAAVGNKCVKRTVIP